ncbi:GRF zinc finger-containing protein [Elsinoe australis]|uniref:GRF zinc finger-containing protein n=1 Tax=Elsinoe australis TaxID=40998 RepID=A0A4U7B9M0_9PEZI|nr:GRF zinc finger-containing protein [Elsinoe australis]
MSFRRGPRTPARSRYNPSTPTSKSYSKSRGPPTTTSPKGLFSDGAWHCDCTPRLPAEHFRVKKEGKNHGRWFYTCQNSEGKRCGFFLWDEDAKVREEGAVLGGKRTEVGREGEVGRGRDGGIGSGGQEGQANPAWLKTQTQEEKGGIGDGESKKRTREIVDLDAETEDEDEFGEPISWPPTAVETPSKRQRTDEYVTPATTTTTKRKLPWLNYEEEEATTPSKQRTELGALPTPSRTRPNEVQDPATSPATGRFRDAMRSPPADAGVASARTLSKEVFELLQANGVDLAGKVEGDLRAALNRHEMKLQGVIKGRDLVRTALKGKEGKIVELQGRVAGLEAEREVLRGALGGCGDRRSERVV